MGDHFFPPKNPKPPNTPSLRFWGHFVRIMVVVAVEMMMMFTCLFGLIEAILFVHGARAKVG